jgi:hypothetical protein
MFIDVVEDVAPEFPDEPFRTALFEVKARAPHDDAFRERLEQFDRYLGTEIRDVVGSGVESGAFRADVDPEEAATLLVTLVSGAHSRRIVLGDDAGVPAAIESYVDDLTAEATTAR